MSSGKKRSSKAKSRQASKFLKLEDSTCSSDSDKNGESNISQELCVGSSFSSKEPYKSPINLGLEKCASDIGSTSSLLEVVAVESDLYRESDSSTVSSPPSIETNSCSVDGEAVVNILDQSNEPDLNLHEIACTLLGPSKSEVSSSILDSMPSVILDSTSTSLQGDCANAAHVIDVVEIDDGPDTFTVINVEDQPSIIDLTESHDDVTLPRFSVQDSPLRTESSVVSIDSDDDDLPSLQVLLNSKDTSSRATGSGVYCPVCMDDTKQISSDGRQLTSTFCGHVFCDACIRHAVMKNRSCPTCRAKLDVAQLHPIYI